jgi:hypothetical protein
MWASKIGRSAASVPGVPRPEVRRRATTKISLLTIVKLPRAAAPLSKDREKHLFRWIDLASTSLEYPRTENDLGGRR